MRSLRMCHAMAIALERERCDQYGWPAPRIEEVLRRALGNYHRLLSVKMKREGVELPADRPQEIETYAPPVMIGPVVDD